MIFHLQRGGLSLTLMGQGQTYNPICNPKQLTHETLGFSFDTVHTTQQSLVIGQFQTKNKSHWLRCFH